MSLLGFGLFEVGDQAVEPRLPEPTMFLEPAGGFAKRLGREPDPMRSTVHASVQQSCALEDLEVLRDARQRHAERLRELGHGGPILGEPLQNGASRRVGERGEHGAQLRGLGA